MSPESFDPRPLFYQLNWKQRITAWILLAIIFILLVLYSFELSKFGNTFQSESLFKRAWLIFGILGAALGFIVGKAEKDLTEKFKIFVFIFLSALFFAPLLTNLTNRWFSGDSEIKSYEVFEVETIGPPKKISEKHWSTGDYFIFVFEEGELEKIRLNDLTEEPVKGQKIDLEIREGLLGWKFVE